MGDPGDRVDAWLNAEVEPLAPPPGTFGRIRRRARRRKAARAVLSGAGVAIVIAAAVAVPRFASTLQSHASTPPRPVAVGRSSPPRPAPTGSGGSVSTKSSAPVQPGTSRLSAEGSGSPVPPDFQPTSVTFVGPEIGAVIGQAGTPGHCGPPMPDDCTSLAGTSDYGRTWYGVSAPVTGAPDGGQGVSQVRFLDISDGWAFGPQLWVTQDGGGHWTQEATYGMRVTDLETAGDRAFALFASCAGTGAAYASGCSSLALYTSLQGSDQWHPVAGPAASLPVPSSGAGQPASATLVLTGGPANGQGYLLAPSGELLSGPLTGAPWTVASQQVPCQQGGAGPGGQPAGALLAASWPELAVVCTSGTNPASDSQAKVLFVSSNGGKTWSGDGTAPTAGIATSLAFQIQDRLIVLATDAGLYQGGPGGQTLALRQASPNGAAAAEPGFSYVGMTTPSDGVALPADPGLHEVFITTDKGLTWQPYRVSSP
jgi:hypothetical protein